MTLKTSSINRLIMSYLLAIYCFLLPFEEVLVFSFGSLLKVFGFLVMAVAFVFMAANRFRVQRDWLWLLGWFLLCLVSAVWSSSFSWWSYYITIYAGQVFFVFFVVHMPADHVDLQIVKRGLVIGAALASAFLLFLPKSSSFTADGRRTIMFLGAKMDPNILASIIVIAIYCTLSMFRSEKSYFYRIFFALIIALLATGIFLTGSRGSVIALVVSLLLMGALFLFKKDGKKQTFFIFLGVAAVIFLLYFFLPDTLLDSRYSVSNILGLNEYDNKMHNRYTIWLHALRLFIRKPLFGYGYGNFFSAIQTVYRQCASHNIIVLELVEMGLVGSIPILVFFVKTAIKAKKYCSISMFCMFIAVFIISLTLDSLPYKYFWVVLIIIGVSIRQEMESREYADD